MIIQLYPNEEVFGFEHDDDYVFWAKVSDRQAAMFNDVPWLICTQIDADVLMHDSDIDFDIENDVEWFKSAMQVINDILEQLEDNVESCQSQS